MRMIGKLMAIVVVAAAGIWAYHANNASGKMNMDMSPRVTGSGMAFPVTLTTVKPGPIAGSVTYTGSVLAFNEEDVYPRVTGRIVEMPVYPGDRVEKGQVVAQLDDIELTSRVRESEAVAAAAEANRIQTEADVLAAHHGMIQMEKELAAAEAETTYQQAVAERDERLFSKGALSQQESESSRAMAAAAWARVQAAQARLDQAKAMYDSAKKKLETADAMVSQGQAQAKTAQVVRDYVNIRVTTSGYVVKRLVAPGVLVQPGMAVLKIAQIDKVRLQANVGEKDLPLIKVGSPVVVTGTTNGHPSLTARVTSVFPYVDPGARTAVVEAVVDNGNRRFVPGQYVQMQFVTGEHPNALSVPLSAIVRMGGKASVWMVKEEKVESREVTTGLQDSEQVEILKGLESGEQVVARGHEGLYAGAQVAVIPGGASAAAAAEPVEAASAQGVAPRAGGQAGHSAGTMLAQAPSLKTGDMQIALTTVPNPPKMGSNRLRIEVKDASGTPVSDAKVEMSVGMPGMAGPKVGAKATKEPGVYEASTNLAMGGTWTAEVTASRPQGASKSTTFTLEVK
jgi:multidrug efflux pump subunit AcrA (membrane-fusion protein)